MTTSKRPVESEWSVEIVRSDRRRKTVSAKIENGTLVVRAPADIGEAELNPIIEKLQKRLARKLRPIPESDAELEKRAQRLNRAYFGNKFKWKSFRYVKNQQQRYGSCTPSTGKIRISDRVATLPDWVKDYVVVHELCHLKEANHGPKFWKLVNRYPLSERARGYLMALSLEEMEES